MFSDLFLFRYGDNWTPWRRCGNDYTGGPEEMLELEASSEEAISSVSGYSYDGQGNTQSLLASTTAGRSWGPWGSHTAIKRYNSLRKSPGGKLRFLSGDQTNGNFILRQLEFHQMDHLYHCLYHHLHHHLSRHLYHHQNICVCAQNQQNHHDLIIISIKITTITIIIRLEYQLVINRLTFSFRGFEIFMQGRCQTYLYVSLRAKGTACQRRKLWTFSLSPPTPRTVNVHSFETF